MVVAVVVGVGNGSGDSVMVLPHTDSMRLFDWLLLLLLLLLLAADASVPERWRTVVVQDDTFGDGVVVVVNAAYSLSNLALLVLLVPMVLLSPFSRRRAMDCVNVHCDYKVAVASWSMGAHDTAMHIYVEDDDAPMVGKN
jgi:hypothetical protein